MMKKIIYGLAIAAVTLTSCSDFLDKEPSNKLDADKFVIQFASNRSYFCFTVEDVELVAHLEAADW